MSDLSWLNPTPHAIAVYASSPLSPAATQHSLPSGRYPLLGPDFHRLDRTSLRLAVSLNHLIGERQQCRRQFEAERFGGCAVEHELVFGRLLEQQVAGLLAAQNAIDIAGRSAEPFHAIGPVKRQTAELHEERFRINRRHATPRDESDDLVAQRVDRAVG